MLYSAEDLNKIIKVKNMTIKELFDRNGNLYIRGSYYGVYKSFLDYEDYIVYLNNHFDNNVMNQILNGKFEECSTNIYSLYVKDQQKSFMIYAYEYGWWFDISGQLRCGLTIVIADYPRLN